MAKSGGCATAKRGVALWDSGEIPDFVTPAEMANTLGLDVRQVGLDVQRELGVSLTRNHGYSTEALLVAQARRDVLPAGSASSSTSSRRSSSRRWRASMPALATHQLWRPH